MAESEAESGLLHRALGGDRKAFEALIARVESRVRAFIRSRMRPGFRRRLDLDEIVQDTFVRAYQSIDRFRGKDLESFVRWTIGVSRIALIKAVDQVGRVGLEIVKDVADTNVSPTRAQRREERLERLEAALDHLREDYREVLYLTRIKGLALKEVSERMGRSPEATKKLLGRALRKLRESFGDTESFHLPGRGIRSRGEGHGGG